MTTNNTKYWLRSSQSSFLDTNCLVQDKAKSGKEYSPTDISEDQDFDDQSYEVYPDPLMVYKLREDLHLALENVNDDIINGKMKLKTLSEELTSKWMADILTQQDVISSLEDTIEEKDKLILDLKNSLYNSNLASANFKNDLLEYIKGNTTDMPLDRIRLYSLIYQQLDYNNKGIKSLKNSDRTLVAPFKLAKRFDFCIDLHFKHFRNSPTDFLLEDNTENIYLTGVSYSTNDTLMNCMLWNKSLTDSSFKDTTINCLIEDTTIQGEICDFCFDSKALVTIIFVKK